MNIIDYCISTCRAQLPGETATDEAIDFVVNSVIQISQNNPLFDEKERQHLSAAILKKRLLEIYNVSTEEYKTLTKKDSRKPWLINYRAENPQRFEGGFWDRYKIYLETEKEFAPKVVNSIDRLTDDILDHLFNPLSRNVSIGKKGLVVGQVQSGKTANYTGLICKAADAGFNLIIVLAGSTNDLRSQTQTRLDEDFLGFDTQFERAEKDKGKIGVGMIPRMRKIDVVASSLTTSAQNGDFRRNSASGIAFNTNDTLLLVVKKNSSVLRRINEWLDAQGKISDKIEIKSLLVIDDEADQASVNTKKDELSAINKGIRSILKKFHRTAYVGYTATPFANIFINIDDEEDLFPKDFIINLPSPSNYIGPKLIFGIGSDDERVLPIVRQINDYSVFFPDSHKKDDPLPEDIPESLKKAIKSFIIACAIRCTRGQKNKHNSMLVHVARFVCWQQRITELVSSYFNSLKNSIKCNDEIAIDDMKAIFETDFTITTNKILKEFPGLDTRIQESTWNIVKGHLKYVVNKIQVKELNGSSKDSLQYYDNRKEGLYVIAVGGDKLSRGLTLEGLTTSYYLRASKLYDTLMQMGRWFGYRPGYVDVCRLYTSEELCSWFKHITLASEELREEFDALCASGGTPDDYGLKVRTDPGRLQITAVSKMRSVEKVKISWSGRIAQTYLLSINDEAIKNNIIITKKLLSVLNQYSMCGNDYCWRNIGADKVIDFIRKFIVAPSLKSVNMQLIAKYIQNLNDNYSELSSWSIVVKNVERADSKYPAKRYSLRDDVVVTCGLRTANEDNKVDYFIKNYNITSGPLDEFIDLSENDITKGLGLTKNIFQEKFNKEWKNNYPSTKVIRDYVRDAKNPLLLIYPLHPQGANIPNCPERQYTLDDNPFIGIAIVFPKSGHELESGVEFAVNSGLIKDFIDNESDFDNTNDNVYED